MNVAQAERAINDATAGAALLVIAAELRHDLVEARGERRAVETKLRAFRNGDLRKRSRLALTERAHELDARCNRLLRAIGQAVNRAALLDLRDEQAARFLRLKRLTEGRW